MSIRLLNEAQGSLLDDEELLITLQTSKATSQDIKEQLETAEETELQIDAAREVRTFFGGFEIGSQLCALLLQIKAKLQLLRYIFLFSTCVPWLWRAKTLNKNKLELLHVWIMVQF